MNAVQGCAHEHRAITVGRKVVLSVVTFVLAGPIPARMNAQQAAPLVFDQVTVVDVEQGKLFQNQRVVITNNRIEAVGDAGAVELPQGAQVIEAKGKYLIPGLWDLHVHLAHSEFLDVTYSRWVANGVTGIREAGSGIPIDTFHQRRREILAGTLVGPPRQLISGRSINGQCRNAETAKNRTLGFGNTMCVIDSADARHLVDSLKAVGVDMLKPRELPRELDFVMAAEARRLGIPFGGHALNMTAIEAADSGWRILDHLDIPTKTSSNRWRIIGTTRGAEAITDFCAPGIPQASVSRCDTVATHLRKNGTWFVPTLSHMYQNHLLERADSILEIFRAGREAEWMYRSLRDAFHNDTVGDSTAGIMSLMQRVDLPLLAGTDCYNSCSGVDLHAELAMLVAEGVTPLGALQAATLNPAKMLRATDSLGTIAAGKLADLVLLDANPLADITNTLTIRAVVANGRYFGRGALDQLLAKAE